MNAPHFLPFMLWGWAGAAGLMFLLWLLQRRTHNAGIVDVGWAFALGALAVLAAATGEGWLPRRILLALLGGLWGGRLAWHLFTDRVWGREEEGRYRHLRSLWRARPQLAFFLFFQAQALLAALLALPFFLAAGGSGTRWAVWDLVAVTLWIAGWVGESVADRQLQRFKARPDTQGRTCREGLWRYSRHPNYFFEWITWCGHAALGLGAAGGWLGLLSPALLLLSMWKVTGIPPTEAQALRSRGEDYRRYQRTTSAFFPWWPKEES